MDVWGLSQSRKGCYMKKKVPPICNHQWLDICIFRTVEGDRMLQQQCKKCKDNRYVKLEEKDSKKEK